MPVVLTIPPKYVVSQVMGFLKGKLALRHFDRFPQLWKLYWGHQVWSRGYCVSTVGLNEEQIARYVREQLEQGRKIEERTLWNK